MRVHLVGQSVNHAVEKTFCPIFSQRLSPLSPLGHKKKRFRQSGKTETKTIANFRNYLAFPRLSFQ